MKGYLGLFFCMVLLSGQPVTASSWSVLATKADVMAATSLTNAQFGPVAVSSSMQYAAVDIYGASAPNHKIVIISPGGTPKVRLLVSQNALRTAVDAVNGSNSIPNSVMISALAFTSDGTLLAVTGANNSFTDTGALFAIDTATGALRVMSYTQEFLGSQSMVVIGTHAFVARGSSVLRVDANSPASDGSAVPTTVVTSAQLEAATADSAFWVNINGCAARGNSLILVNSGSNYNSPINGAYGSNDNVIQATVDGAGGVSGFNTIIPGNELDAALGTVDVALPAVAVLPQNKLWLYNSTTHVADSRGFLKVTGASPSARIAFEPASRVATEIGGATSDLIVPQNGLAYHPTSDTIAASVINHPTALMISRNLRTAAEDWNHLE